MKFTPSHEWIYVEDGNIGTVGITLWAQKELGEIVYVELPEVGSEVKAGEEIAVLESTKAAADIYAPVSGLIKEVNEKLKEDTSLLNHSPEKQGWLFKIALKSKEELEGLLSQSGYEALITD